MQSDINKIPVFIQFSAGGYSLLESLLSLILLALLAFFGLPQGLSFYQTNQLKARQDELQAALSIARNLAFARGEALVLSPLKDNDWSYGMQLFLDNKDHYYESGTELLQQWQWNGRVHLEWTGFQSKNYLLISAKPEQAALNGHFDLSAGKKRLRLVVNRLGNTRSLPLDKT